MSGAQRAANDEISLTRDFIAFLGRILVGRSTQSLEAAWRDRVKIWRDRNAHLFQDKYDQVMGDRGLEGKTVCAPLALAFPFLDRVVLEEDGVVANFWAS